MCSHWMACIAVHLACNSQRRLEKTLRAISSIPLEVIRSNKTSWVKKHDYGWDRIKMCLTLRTGSRAPDTAMAAGVHTRSVSQRTLLQTECLVTLFEGHPFLPLTTSLKPLALHLIHTTPTIDLKHRNNVSYFDASTESWKVLQWPCASSDWLHLSCQALPPLLPFNLSIYLWNLYSTTSR